MSDIQLYLLEYDSNKQEAVGIAQKTAEKLESKDTKLVELVETLGEYLNNEDGTIRAKTMAYLADVLTALPPKVLSRQQSMSHADQASVGARAPLSSHSSPYLTSHHRPGDLLNEFILARIANGADGLGHCARGLIALENLGSFDQERVVTIVNTLLENTNPLTQFKLQSERFAVLSLMDLIMSKYRQALQNFHDTSTDFMPRFVAYFDGEKDPRNLMIVFSILNVAMVEWDVSLHAQDLFEAVFNYFPITFRPPPGDPYGITAQQLKDRLRDCIASTAVFAPHAFPALLDKLDSTSPNVKRDVLQTITSCVSRYGPTTVNLYSVTLWDALKFEILNVQEEDLAEEALLALQEIGTQLSGSTHEGPLQQYIKPIAKECNEHFEDAPTKQSTAAGRIVKSVAASSPEVADLLTRAISPQLFALYQSADSISRKRALLEAFSQILQASLSVYGRWRATAPADISIKKSQPIPTALLEFKNQSLELFIAAVTLTPITEVSFRLLSLQGLRDMAIMRQLLDDESIAKIVRLLNDIVITEQSYGRDDIKAAAIDAMVEIAHQKPQIIIETAIPAFMGNIPDADNEAKGNVAVLEAFAKLSKEQQVFKTVVLRLKNKLNAAIRQQASPRHVLSILLAILYAFSYGALDPSQPDAYAPYYSEIVVPLISEFCAPSHNSVITSEILHDESVLEAVGRICNSIIRPQVFAAQTEISRNIYTFFQNVDGSQLPPYAHGNPVALRRMIVSTQLLAALQREANPSPDVDVLFHGLVNFATTNTDNPLILDTTLHQLSVFTNKFMSPAKTQTTISPLLSSDGNGFLSPTHITQTTIPIALAVLKGLAFRLDPILSTTLPTFLSLLADPTHGALIARGLSTLLAPTNLLTKENHCLIYRLHKARIFSLAIPFLSTHFRSLAAPAPKRNYLVALAGILHHVPYALVQPELPALVPLLLQSLASDALTAEDDAATPVRAAAIALFATVLASDPAAVQEHAGSLIGRLLAVAVVATATTASATPPPAPPKLRAAALACLASFVGSVSDAALLPFRREVVRRLAGALDDPRRAVRAEAVRCRARWEGLGDEEEGEGKE